jgi:hypothetical protein
MIRHRRLKFIAGLAALLLSGSVWARADARGEAGSDDSAPYREFITSGSGASLLAIARRAFLDAAGMQAPSPIDLPEFNERPAGPRDAPPSPMWPSRPTGLVLCLKLGDEVLGCEGGRLPTSDDLAAAIADLAVRLPNSRSRGKPRTLKPAQRGLSILEAAFVTEVRQPSQEIAGARRRKPKLPDGVDPGLVGFIVSGEGGDVVTLPGEARSVGAALRIARKAGAGTESGEGLRLWWYRPVIIGSVPIVSP